MAVIAGQEPHNALQNLFVNNGYCTMQRDELIAKKKGKHRIILSGQERAEADEYGTAESDVEICDQLETVQKSNIEIDAVK